jgi:hypothetical protein
MWTYSSNKEIVDAINSLKQDFNSKINSLSQEINSLKQEINNQKYRTGVYQNYSGNNSGFIETLSSQRILGATEEINSAYLDW